jgi:hypothetical protein
MNDCKMRQMKTDSANKIADIKKYYFDFLYKFVENPDK